MKNKLIFGIYGLTMFLLGALVSFGLMMSSRDSGTFTAVARNANPSAPATINTLALPTSQAIPIIHASQADANNSTNTNPNNKTNSFNTQAFSQERAQQIVNSIPDSQLNDYVGRFMSAKDAELISDKRQFANRAVEELYKPNDSQPLIGQVLLSTSPDIPTQSINTNSLAKQQKLYAHLNTFGKVPLGANVFVKWVNRNTGEVLLFEKKLIVPNSNNNWVSYQPYEGWQVGSYDIRFYQFTSQLEPVAQLSYDVNEVVD